MFLDLFYGLRDEGLPLGMQEWLTFMEALKKGLHGCNLLRFYYLARACLVKSEAFYDAFDRVFARVFRGVEGSLDGITDDLLDYSGDPATTGKDAGLDRDRTTFVNLSGIDGARRLVET